MGAPDNNHRRGHSYMTRDKTVTAAKKIGVGT
jgi:hypothetical protein